MILDIYNNNLKFVAFSSNIIKCTNSLEINKYIKLKTFNSKESSYNSFYTYCNQVNPQNMEGIFLGNLDDIKEILNKKDYSNNIDSIKKNLYVDPLCKYPRFKLSYENFKVKRSLENADLIVISKPNYNIYTAQVTGSYKRTSDILILYSIKEDCYYFIDYTQEDYAQNYSATIFSKLYKEHSKLYIEDQLERWADFLVTINILPNDVVKFYQGPVIALPNIKFIQHFNNLLYTHKSFIYEEDLDKYISKNYPRMLLKDYQYIDSMLKSTDSSTISLGIKMISNYNIYKSKGTILYLIRSNWLTIIENSASKSVAFLTLMRLLGYSSSDMLYRTSVSILKDAYKNYNDPIDKDIVGTVVQEEIKEQTNLYINNTWFSICKLLNISTEIITKKREE